MPKEHTIPKVVLEALEDVVVPADTAPFIIKDQFKKGGALRISMVWEEFRRRYFGKVEQPGQPIRLRKYRLLSFAPDGPIIAELGGEDKVQSTVAAAYALMRKQPNGEAGFLQTNGFANIFYVKDKEGVLCAIRTGWASDGWVIDAIPVADPLAWNGKHEIFCPIPPA